MLKNWPQSSKGSQWKGASSSSSMVEPQEEKKGPGACADVGGCVGEELKALVIYIYFHGIYMVFFNTLKTQSKNLRSFFIE